MRKKQMRRKQMKIADEEEMESIILIAPMLVFPL